jgi:hypothetical protein
MLITIVYYGMRRKVQIRDRPCPYCCKDVNGEASRCPYCTSWIDVDVQRRVENEYNDGKETSSTGERSLSATILGTSAGLLREKGSVDESNDPRTMGAGAGARVAVGTGAMNNMYNSSNVNNGPYTNALPGQLQGQSVYDGTGIGHQNGHGSVGVHQQNSMGVDGSVYDEREHRLG